MEDYKKYKLEQEKKYGIIDDNNTNLEFLEKDDKYIVVVSKKTKIILKSEYEIVGTYDNITKIFTWSWGNPFIEKNLFNRVIKLKSINLLKTNLDFKSIELFTYFQKNIAFVLSNSNIETLKLFVLFNTKGNMIIENVKDNVIEFILIKNIFGIY